jgi:hypothetical protein
MVTHKLDGKRHVRYGRQTAVKAWAGVQLTSFIGTVQWSDGSEGKDLTSTHMLDVMRHNHTVIGRL